MTEETVVRQLEMGPLKSPSTNERGNTVYYGYHPIDRYHYDLKICTREKGWKQYDTTQDAHYFGVWVHPELQLIFTYAEGDTSLVKCASKESYHAELKYMAEFYGPPPPAFIVLSMKKKLETHVFDPRPE